MFVTVGVAGSGGGRGAAVTREAVVGGETSAGADDLV
jgi:hypothetical protein